jgi:hypothetical protein
VIKFVPGQWIGITNLGINELNKLRVPAENAILRAMLHLENAVKRKLSGARSGRLYRVSKTGRLHQASAPGEPPAVLFGKLRQSITHIGPTWEGFHVSGEVGTNLEYAARLEYGGVDSRGVQILPRPYLAPTVLEEEDRLEQILTTAVRS